MVNREVSFNKSYSVILEFSSSIFPKELQDENSKEKYSRTLRLLANVYLIQKLLQKALETAEESLKVIFFFI
jgi:regulator of sirC expression with transglutaminase-like and TPR domain